MVVKLTDKVYTESGAPVQGAVAQAILTNGTTTAVTATDTTDANGLWAFDSGIAGHQADLADPGVGYWYDVRIASGMQYRQRYGAIKAMMSMVYLAQTIVIAAGQKLDTSVAALQIPARTSDPAQAAGQIVFRTDTKDLRVSDGTSFYSYLLPPGSLLPYAGAAAPGGFLLCDGTAVSRTTYAALFAACGVAYGPGDGSTTFNVPDLRGRAPLGAGTGTGLTARARGAVGGEETHVLATAEAAAHGHTITDVAHNHTQNAHSHLTSNGGQANVISTNGTGNLFYESGHGNTQDFLAPATAVNVGANSGITNTNNTPAAAGHNTMMPFAVVSYIVKF